MSNNGTPQPPYNPEGVPQPPYNPDGVPQPPHAANAAQHGQPAQPNYTAQPGYPAPGAPFDGNQFGGNQPERNPNKKPLLFILGGLAVVVIIALVVVFTWLVPSMTKPVAAGDATSTVEPSPAESAPASDQPASDEAAAEEPSEDSDASGMPDGAIALPSVWESFDGPSNVPADGDPQFSKWVTGESSFQYLAEWTHDESFGITKDPTTGAEIQKRAQGTTETDGDGIALAYAFFAESEEGKYGKDPAKVKAAIEEIEARFKGMTATELPQNLVGHKCASDFTTSMPEIREFRRGAAVVIGFTCTNARGEEIQAVNLFSVTPWGTPQMLGVSGHKEYWDAHPGLIQQLANSYRINKWKLG
ncbi:hypothetical protein [Paenarthrobacter ureafaciens]|uniref:hypothetical protein n=1 Tax=Paenarthrobacter ureafaciens TaxID=37931 RepID=UPI003CF40E1A